MQYMKCVLAFGTFALGAAMAASSYRMSISNPTWINGNELKPGDYKVQVEGDKVMFKGNDSNVEAAAKVQTGAEKFPVTSVRSDEVNGKHQLKEIDFGGTKTSILFGSGTGAAGE